MFDAKTDLVSICIPTYNSALFIEKTIISALNQTYQNIEVVISDDCSFDNTLNIIAAFNNPRIKIFNNEINKGITANWNSAIEYASGKYVKLLCGDDILAPTCIEKQVTILQNDLTCKIALVSCLSTVINSNDKILHKRKNILKIGLNDSKKTIVKSICLGTNIIGEPMAGLFRKIDFSNDCRFDGINPYLIDFDFWVKLLQKGSLFVVNEHLASFRISSNSLSATLNIKQYKLFCKFAKLLHSQGHISFLCYSVGCVSSFILMIVRNLIFVKNKN